MQLKVRPQPLGIYPLPANYLLISGADIDDEIYKDLMRGVFSGAKNAGKLRYFYEAISSNTETAIENLPNDDTPETGYNRFVLEPSREKYEQLKSEFSGEILTLLEAVAFSLHLIDAPPNAENCTDEIAAFVSLTQATEKIERGEIEAAIELLKKAVEESKTVSPVFAALVKANLAETLHQTAGTNAQVLTLYKQAVEALDKTELEYEKASFNLNLGICYQEISNGQRGALLEAARHYQAALRFFKADKFPAEFALAQNNLALAYLSMPMHEASDQLRVGIAVQSLREVLKIWTRETNADGWASTQLNLANALQYLPSKHIEENLMEAVNLYEEILEYRTAAQNLIGYARLLSNQGNALAHLGIFAPAVEKLTEAKQIFETHGETDAANAVSEHLTVISQQLSVNNEQLSVGK